MIFGILFTYMYMYMLNKGFHDIYTWTIVVLRLCVSVLNLRKVHGDVVCLVKLYI